MSRAPFDRLMTFGRAERQFGIEGGRHVQYIGAAKDRVSKTAFEESGFMSLDIIYSCGDQEFKFRATSQEFEALAKFAEKNCKEAFGVVFGQPDFDDSALEKTVVLSAALKTIMDTIRGVPESLGYIYTTKSEYPRGTGFVTGGSGTMGGVKIDGQEYSLEGGYETCALTKYWYDENGKPHRGEPQDIRHMTFIKTDQDSLSGDVTIRKKKAGRGVLKKLAELERFLAGCSGEEVAIALG
jgi:hypothetical protein